MGVSDSKIALKQTIFRLADDSNIAPDDHLWDTVSRRTAVGGRMCRGGCSLRGAGHMRSPSGAGMAG